jgi:hypothetical protein
MAKEETLAKRLADMEAKRKKLRRELQLVRMRAAGKRRKESSKVYRAVGALLQKEDEGLFQKLASRLRSAPKGRRGRKPGRPPKNG